MQINAFDGEALGNFRMTKSDSSRHIALYLCSAWCRYLLWLLCCMISSNLAPTATTVRHLKIDQPTRWFQAVSSDLFESAALEPSDLTYYHTLSSFLYRNFKNLLIVAELHECWSYYAYIRSGNLDSLIVLLWNVCSI